MGQPTSSGELGFDCARKFEGIDKNKKKTKKRRKKCLVFTSAPLIRATEIMPQSLRFAEGFHFAAITWSPLRGVGLFPNFRVQGGVFLLGWASKCS
jgi:hypothetical protein